MICGVEELVANAGIVGIVVPARRALVAALRAGLRLSAAGGRRDRRDQLDRSCRHGAHGARGTGGVGRVERDRSRSPSRRLCPALHAGGRERVRDIRIVHHLDGLSLAKRGQIGTQDRPRAAAGRGPQDHHDLVAGVDEIDDLGDWPSCESATDERDRLLSVTAGARPGWIPAVPFDVGIEELPQRVHVTSQGGAIAAASHLDVGLGHGHQSGTEATSKPPRQREDRDGCGRSARKRRNDCNPERGRRRQQSHGA